MRLGKVQASGYVADVATDDVTQEPRTPAAPEPVISEREVVAEREQVSATG